LVPHCKDIVAGIASYHPRPATNALKEIVEDSMEELFRVWQWRAVAIQPVPGLDMVTDLAGRPREQSTSELTMLAVNGKGDPPILVHRIGYRYLRPNDDLVMRGGADQA
jgi:hypothetical protein